MPLIYQTHRPPQLQQEIRNLYREIGKLDRATASRFTSIISQINGNGNGEPAEGGTVYSWAKMIDITMAPVEGWNHVYFDVAAIEALSYTHLELYAVVMRTSNESPSLPHQWSWRLFGSSPFHLSKWTGGEVPLPDWQGYDGGSELDFVPSTQYWFTTVGVGCFRILPKWSPDDYLSDWRKHKMDAFSEWSHDLAYKPVAPDDGTDALRLLVSYCLPVGYEENCICCKGWVVGRYIVHDQVQWGALCGGM